MPFHTHTLPNGLTLLGEVNPSALSVALGFFVRTGARDETAAVSGVTHFLEHMIFKGTERRDALTVNRDFDRIGAESNAFTSEESTVFYAAVLPEYLETAVDILADILRPSLRSDDFVTEKEVILDEIVRYDVQPAWSAYDQSRRIHYAGHPLGNSILGTTESIRALTVEQMRTYYGQRYVAPNIHVVVAGQFDWATLVELVTARCAGWPAGPIGRQALHSVAGAGGQHLIRRDQAAQEYVLQIAAGPAADDDLRYAGDVLATAIGDATGSRLYWALIDPGLADSVSFSCDNYEAAGEFIVWFSSEPDQAAENLALVEAVLADVQTNGLTDTEIAQAKVKLASREVRGSERTMRRMLDIGRDWTYLRQYRTADDQLAAYDAVDATAIRTLLTRFPLTHRTTLALGPLAELAG
jgi:predicted Zn-dependent peptidase